MPVHKVIRMGHPLLREVSMPVEEDEFELLGFKLLLKDMVETMKHEGGIGLAAPQIAVNKQICIIEIPSDSERYPDAPSSELMYIINPKIKVLDEVQQGFWEGCLSIPGIRGFVERPRKIQVDYQDKKGEPQSIIAENFLATVFQHELDHLFGKLFIDHIKDTTLMSFNEEYEEHWVESPKN